MSPDDIAQGCLDQAEWAAKLVSPMYEALLRRMAEAEVRSGRERTPGEYLLYSFKEVRPGRLFLKQAIYREFDEDSGEVSTAKIFAFTEGGQMIAEFQDMKTNETETRKAKTDPAPNWDQYPDFGVYDSLLREERS